MINSSTNSSINLYSAGVKGFRYPFNKDSLFSGRMTIPQVRRNFLLTPAVKPTKNWKALEEVVELEKEYHCGGE